MRAPSLANGWAALRRAAYRATVSAAVAAALPTARRGRPLAIHFGGARAGSGGGPLVKAGQLRARFGEATRGFSLIYLLSNALYVAPAVLARARRAGVAIVVNQNGVFYPAWYRHGWERENARMAAAQAAADHVIYQSAFCRAASQRFLGVAPRAFEILPNAVDVDAFTPAAPADGSRRPFRFLLTGKIGPSTAYRLQSTIEGLAAARRGGLDVSLIVAGAIMPDVQRSAEQAIARAGLADHVAFRGPFGRAEAPGIYRAADAYLITKHNDPCPNVVLEALACGLPVLYSASGGVPELVGPEAGVGLAVPQTFDETPSPMPQDIAAGMARIMDAHAAMAVAARARAVAHFALAQWLDRHAEIFDRLLRAREGGT